MIGAGSWGTALAFALGQAGETYLWCRDQKQVDWIKETRHNPRYLRDAELPAGVFPTADIADAVYKVQLIIMAVPAKAMAVTAKGVSGVLRTQLRQGETAPLVLSAAKGLEPDTGRLMSEVLADIFRERAVVGALSGPNIAAEVGQGLPTATVIASKDHVRAEAAQRRLSGSRLRAYTNDDVVGVEMGGALKNVIAIAAGIGDGMGAGDNAKAAVMTRGLAEMTRLGRALGARPLTFSGLTGLGDLIVTCSSPHSRNRQLGMAIGKGEKAADAEAAVGQVVEGVNTTREALRLGKKHGVELPIAEAVARVLFEGADCLEVAAGLMQRTGRGELEGLGLLE